MKRSSVIRAASSVLFAIGAESACSAPCVTTTPACAEWLGLAPAGGPSRSLVYRTYALDVRNESITRALIIVHGGSRNADGYYRSALAAGFLAGALDDTIIIAPRFGSNNGDGCRDTLASNELNFKCDPPSDWRTGGSAVGNDKVTSFDVADGILIKLANKGTFPNLRAIVVAGHSGGAFFVTRYAMANQVHDRLGVPVTYVVANAGSFVYLDGLRPTPSAVPLTTPSAMPPSIAPPSNNPPPAFASYPDARACTTYDSWPFGLHNRTGYSARVSEEQLKTQSVARPTTYLLGRLDVLPLQLDEWATCAAMAQGPTNLARGLAWAKYMQEKYGARHRMELVPLCGHNERCMFTSDVALPILFPKGTGRP